MLLSQFEYRFPTEGSCIDYFKRCPFERAWVLPEVWSYRILLAQWQASGSTTLVIYGRNADESLTLRYYDIAAGKLYTIPDAVKL